MAAASLAGAAIAPSAMPRARVLSRNVGSEGCEFQVSAAILGASWLKALDGAAAADARMDRISVRTEAIVARLKVKAAIEIERRAILIQMGPDPRLVGEDEVDLFRTRQKGALDLGRRACISAPSFRPTRSAE